MSRGRSAKAPTSKAVPAVTALEVATMIEQAMSKIREDFKEEFTGMIGSSTKELVQSQFAEFQSQMKEEFLTYLAEALKQQQVTAMAGSPDISTPTAPRPGGSKGGRGFFPTIEAVKREIGRFTMLLDKHV